MITLTVSTVLTILLALIIGPVESSQLTTTQLTLLIVVNILIYISTILSYIGWIMPERVLIWLTKES